MEFFEEPEDALGAGSVEPRGRGREVRLGGFGGGVMEWWDSESGGMMCGDFSVCIALLFFDKEIESAESR